MNARMHHIIAVILVLLVACPVWAGNVIYVDDDAPLNGDGVSWDTAYRYLQDALVRSSVFAEASEGSHAEGAETAGKIEIRVAQGVYLPDRV
ncbi:MAG: hypothetical protein GY809_14085, partial [Planctomycetes bacterium]|nr:hypothetical protein [Planctomycetota bacterium]